MTSAPLIPCYFCNEAIDGFHFCEFMKAELKRIEVQGERTRRDMQIMKDTTHTNVRMSVPAGFDTWLDWMLREPVCGPIMLAAREELARLKTEHKAQRDEIASETITTLFHGLVVRWFPESLVPKGQVWLSLADKPKPPELKNERPFQTAPAPSPVLAAVAKPPVCGDGGPVHEAGRGE